MEPIEAGDGAWGWKKVTGGAGRESGGRRKKEEGRKNRG
jgi:hypothetical protein